MHTHTHTHTDCHAYPEKMLPLTSGATSCCARALFPPETGAKPVLNLINAELSVSLLLSKRRTSENKHPISAQTRRRLCKELCKLE